VVGATSSEGFFYYFKQNQQMVAYWYDNKCWNIRPQIITWL